MSIHDDISFRLEASMILIIESEKLAVSYSASMDQVGIGSSSIYLYFLFSSLFLTTCHFFLLPFTITKRQATSTLHDSSLSHTLYFSLCPLPLFQNNILFYLKRWNTLLHQYHHPSSSSSLHHI